MEEDERSVSWSGKHWKTKKKKKKRKGRGGESLSFTQGQQNEAKQERRFNKLQHRFQLLQTKVRKFRWSFSLKTWLDDDDNILLCQHLNMFQIQYDDCPESNKATAAILAKHDVNAEIYRSDQSPKNFISGWQKVKTDSLLRHIVGKRSGLRNRIQNPHLVRNWCRKPGLVTETFPWIEDKEPWQCKEVPQQNRAEQMTWQARTKNQNRTWPKPSHHWQKPDHSS